MTRAEWEHLANCLKTPLVITTDLVWISHNATVASGRDRRIIVVEKVAIEDGFVERRIAVLAPLLPTPEAPVEGYISEEFIAQRAVARPSIGFVNAFGDPDFAGTTAVDAGVVQGVVEIGIGVRPRSSVVSPCGVDVTS